MKEVTYFPLAGGVDKSTAPLAIEPGKMIDCVNWEINRNGRGYVPCMGFEPFDGSDAPSDGTYIVIQFENGSAEIVTGDTVDGSGSGASGYAIIDAVLESGTYGGGDAAGYIVLTGVSGTFLSTDDLEVAAAKVGEIADGGVGGEGAPASPQPSPGTGGGRGDAGAPSTSTDATWRSLCADYYMTLINAVPGSGPLLGIHTFNGKRYAFRTNAGDTATDMYVESASGWVLCDLGEKVSFTSGATTAVAEGQTLTQGGVTSTIRRVVVTAGSWTSGITAGFLLITGRGGGNYTAGAATTATSTITLAGAQTANTITKGGRFECITHNFGGHAGGNKMYCVSGVGKAFEYNGYGICHITTGMTTDTPTHIRAHQGHLILSFSGGSLQNSSLVNAPYTMPFVWSVVQGAAEQTTGDEITGMEQVQGEALAVFCKNRTRILYGSSSADWNLQEHSDVAGAVEWTIQSIREPIFIDANNITMLSASAVYGGFSSAALSSNLMSFMQSKAGTEVASVISLDKTQYRVFYSDGYFVTMSLSAQGVTGFTIGWYPIAPVCTSYDPDTGRMFFGDADGFVYEIDKGMSHAGEEITYYMKLPFNFVGTPRGNKKFTKAIFELDTVQAGSVRFGFSCDFDYLGSSIPQGAYLPIEVSSGSLIWDVGEWDVYSWAGDSDPGSQPESYIFGIASEISLLIYMTNKTTEQFTLNGIFLEYHKLGDKR